ncbi:MAG: YihY/virulence factor BrkB family protein, partial [Wujia sp.]
QTAFFVLLSFFPFIMLMLMLVYKNDFIRNNLISYILNAVPGQLREYVLYLADDILYSNTNPFTIVTVVVSLWSAAKSFQALSYGLDRIYGVERAKNYILTRIFSAMYTLVFMILCLVFMLIHIFGSHVAKKIIVANPKLANATLLILSFKGLFTFVILFILLILIYYQLPERKGKFREEITGAGAASAGILLMTELFSFYIRYIYRSSYMYGSLASIVLLAIWVYIVFLIILYGAQFNVFLKMKKRIISVNVDTKKSI